MSTNAAKPRSSAPLRPADEPGVYRLRVFYLQVNGRRSVVGDWQLYETMRRLKLLNMYSELERLEDAGSLDFSASVHGAPLAVSVVVGTWQVRLGAGRSRTSRRGAWPLEIKFHRRAGSETRARQSARSPDRP